MLRYSRSAAFLLFFLLAGHPCAFRLWAQTTEKATKGDVDRSQAEDLYQQGKFVDAMPLFEKLVADHPTDLVVHERWGWCMFQYASTLSDPEQRKKVRARARAIAVEAKGLGDTSALLQVMLDLPEDGSDPKFSDRKEVDEVMREAEAHYARGELDHAREGYLRALMLDPTNYEAALFIGDVYFKQHLNGSAGEWFARAIQIDANRETAYRYWGDALVAMDRDDDARAKYIEAIIAEPFNNRPWQALGAWAQRHKVSLNYVRLKDRVTVKIDDNKNVTMTLDNTLPKDANLTAWTTYGIGRAGWHTEKFEKEFPNVPRSRRTLQEEVHALGLMITVLKELKEYEKTRKDLDPAIQSVIKIQELGFLEPFILINRADKDIAQDYEPYRAVNRDTIRRYLDEFVVPKLKDATN